MSIANEFAKHGIDIGRIKTIGKTKCPKCSDDRKNKSDPCLSIDIDKGVWKCHHCEWAGSIGIKPMKVSNEKNYAKPIFNNRTDLSEGLVNWFFKRGISQQTLIDFKITESEEWMPQVQKKRNCINFNYFRDDELINVKYRDGDKNFKLVKDAELIFYNLDSIKGQKECTLVEGEIEAMSWHEIGIKNVVSVPNGASKGSRLDYLDNCWEYFEDMDKVYLALDDDEAGHALRDELARRIGFDKVLKVTFDGLKDANDLLVSKGKESLLKRLELAEQYPINGIYCVDDVMEDIMDFYHNGLPEGYRTGNPAMDEIIRYELGMFTVVTGIPSHGKSIMLDQIAIGLSLTNDWKFGVFSPESEPMGFYYSRMITRLTGKPFSKNKMDISELNEANSWLRDRFFMVSPESDFTIDTILEKAISLVRRKGIKGLIIDPWNMIQGTISSGSDNGHIVVQYLNKIKDFAKRWGVHVFLVAHPTKLKKKEGAISDREVATLYDVSGSSNFFNLAHNGLTVYRSFDEGYNELIVTKIKWQHHGKHGSARFTYCNDNARFVSEGEDPYRSWISSMHKPLRMESNSAISPSKEFEQNNNADSFLF